MLVLFTGKSKLFYFFSRSDQAFRSTCANLVCDISYGRVKYIGIYLHDSLFSNDFKETGKMSNFLVLCYADVLMTMFIEKFRNEGRISNQFHI